MRRRIDPQRTRRSGGAANNGGGQSAHLEPKDHNRVFDSWATPISDVPPHHRFEPLALVGDWFRACVAEFRRLSHLVHVGRQSLAYRFAAAHERPHHSPLLYANMRKAPES